MNLFSQEDIHDNKHASAVYVFANSLKSIYSKLY